MQTLIIVLGVIVVVFIVAIAIMAGIIKSANQNTDNVETEEETENTLKIEYPYYGKYLLSSNEYNFYKTLKPITDKYKLQIIPKVRMWDIIGVNKGLNKSEKTSAENRIKSKHFDFVLADSNLYIKCVIELDDSSHNSEKAKASDEFKNKVCETVNLPIIRCLDINGVEEQICDKLKLIKM